MVIGNLTVEVSDSIVVHIVDFKKMEVESYPYYFYDYLEPLCNKLDIDFSTLVVSLYAQVKLDDIIDVI